MEIKIKTLVESNLESVYSGFNLELFEKLLPVFPKSKVLRFDGCISGDVVTIEMNFLLFKQKWESLITYYHKEEKEMIFVDTGSTLPFFLKSWEHRHILVKSKNGRTLIIDNILFSSGFFLFDWILYPILYFQFSSRQPIYKRFFSAK